MECYFDFLKYRTVDQLELVGSETHVLHTSHYDPSFYLWTYIIAHIIGRSERQDSAAWR